MMIRLLLVEDNEMNRDMLSRRLRARGFAVQTAADGDEALCLVAADPPDLILMDLSLPNVDGWAATRQLKASEAYRAIPVIALTAHALHEERDKALAAGCDDYDTKPVEFERLLRKISALVAQETAM